MARIYLLAITLLLAFLAPTAALASASDIQAASRSVVRVAVIGQVGESQVFTGHGSGVAVTSDTILTSAHVVEEANYDEGISFLIIPSEGSKGFKARLLAWNPDNDLALLKITDGGKLTPAAFLTGAFADGSDVFAIGYPANVDVALQQQDSDTLQPQAPVKTRGSVSAGRSSKLFETVLHTAPIAPGNSGGPIVDNCGRVVGINSFGSQAQSGGAEFYFAVAMKEIVTFLRSEKIGFRSVANACRSAAELSQAEARREAEARAKIAAEQRIAAEKRESLEGDTRRRAEYRVIAERENRLAFAGLLLALSLFAAGAALVWQQRGNRNMLIIFTMGSIGLFALAILIFLLRPSFDKVDDLVRKALEQEELSGDGDTAAKLAAGKMTCKIAPERSRITVSNDADVIFDWAADGCVNGRTQYAEDGAEWRRSFVPNSDARVSVVTFDPVRSRYRIQNYLLGSGAMAKAREARQRHRVRGCSSEQGLRTKVAEMNGAIRDLLPNTPNEILSFDCRREALPSTE